MYLDRAVFSRSTDVGLYRPRKGMHFTQTAEQQARHWDRVVATTLTRAPSMPAPVLLQELIQDVDMWRYFVVDYVFGGHRRIKSIRRIVGRGSCEHIILSRGHSPEIGQALYAAGLHTCFSCIVDTEGTYLWPRPSFDPDRYGPSCLGDPGLIPAAFYHNTGLAYSYGKDLLLANQIAKRWKQVLPHWSKCNKGKRPRMVYIDDNAEVEALPRKNVKVIRLPPEVMHGFTSIAGCVALSAVNFDALGPDCVVVWDFDCTISSVHMHKTLNMLQTPGWLSRWGPPLVQWWAAHLQRAKKGLKPPGLTGRSKTSTEVTSNTKNTDMGSKSKLSTESHPSDACTRNSQPAACPPTELVETQKTSCSSERQVLECGPISLKASEGELVVVTGDTGTGKSTLLNCFMEELRLKTGSIVMMTNRIGYCGQQPWIMAGTFRENIVWGAPLDLRRYEHVLTACALRTDVEQLADGDQTEIGERGVNLSGGQKARVALARVMYAQPQVCFLDDPLAALDPRVGAHIMQHAVQSMQRAGVCVVLATHHVYIKKHADVVVHMQLNANGDACHVSRIDRKNECPTMNGEHSLSPSASLQSPFSGVPSPPPRPVIALPAIPGFIPAPFLILTGDFAEDQKIETSETKTDPVASKTATGNQSKTRQTPLKLVEAEERSLGNLEAKTYRGYAKAAGYFWCVVVVLLFAGSQAVAISADFWLKQWSDIDDQQQTLYPVVFAVLTVSVVILGFTRGLIFFNTALRAATNLHNQAYDAVVGSPLSFFTANPVGRILNKFSSDLGQVDEELPKVLFECFDALALCLGSMVLCVIAVPWVILALVPLGIGMIFVRRHFLFSARELKRMESTTKSPVLGVVSVY